MIAIYLLGPIIFFKGFIKGVTRPLGRNFDNQLVSEFRVVRNEEKPEGNASKKEKE